MIACRLAGKPFLNEVLRSDLYYAKKPIEKKDWSQVQRQKEICSWVDSCCCLINDTITMLVVFLSFRLTVAWIPLMNCHHHYQSKALLFYEILFSMRPYHFFLHCHDHHHCSPPLHHQYKEYCHHLNR